MITATAETGTAEAISSIIAAEHLVEIAFDEGDFATHMSLWAEGHFEFVSPFGSYDEPAAYEAWVREFYDYTQQSGGTRHLVLNPVVKVNGDTAELTAYLQVVNRTDGSFMGSSVMHDRLIKTEAGWRFTYRSVVLDQTP